MIPIILFATTFTVDINGGQDFTSIQAAINAASWDGDRIIVYPGTYCESVNYLEKNLVIGSLEMTTGNESYIGQTIIDGENQRRCVNIFNITEGAVLEGFTIKNGLFYSGWGISASGINVGSTNHLIIKNCHIYHNMGYNMGVGGVKIEASDDITLSGLSIHDNRSNACAGLFVYNSTNVSFDSENRCSIYNNIASGRVDVEIYSCLSDVNVILDTVTVANPSAFFIENDANYYTPFDMTLEYEHYMYEEIDQDLYVSPNGNNNNDGLTPETPLQAIQKAVYLIKSNPDNPHTIHLASGDYSLALNNQLFPIGMKSNIKIIGGENTNIYCDDEKWGYLVCHYKNNFTIKNINFFPETSVDFPYHFPQCQDFKLKNLNFNSNGDNIFDTTLNITQWSSGILDSINIQGVTAIYRSAAQIELRHGEVKNCNFSNNSSTMDPDEAGYGLVIGVDVFPDDPIFTPALLVENCVFQNNKSYKPFSIFGHGYSLTGRHIGDVILNNLAFINNNSQSVEYNTNIKFHFGPDPVYINNALVVGNGTAEWAVSLGGNITINNSVFYNHSLWQNQEFRIEKTYRPDHYPFPYPTTVTFNNCAIKGGDTSYYDVDPEHNSVTFNNTIDIADYEMSDLFTYEDSTDFMSYQLAPNSPLIDAGYVMENNYTPTKDLLGHNRIWGDQIDIGPFEYGSVGNEDETEENIPPLKEMEIKNYPNPFKPGNGKGGTGTTIAFKTPKLGRVTIDIFNIKGQKVRKLKDVSMLKGEHKFKWGGFNDNYRKVSSGIYFCTIKVDDKLLGVHKMLVLK